jgi:hypothetical protein
MPTMVRHGVGAACRWDAERGVVPRAGQRAAAARPTFPCRARRRVLFTVSHISVPPRPDPVPATDEPGPGRHSRRQTGLAIVAALAVLVAVLVQCLPSSDDAATSSAIPADVCPRTRELLDQASSAAATHLPPVGDLTELLPTATTTPSIPYPDTLWPTPADVADGRSDPASWVTELTQDGYKGGVWRECGSDTGRLQVEVLQFDSHAHAIGFQDWIIYASCPNATEAFAVPGVPGSIGLRLLWPSGDISDQVSFVRGSRRYLAAVRAGSAPARATVLSLTDDLAALAS